MLRMRVAIVYFAILTSIRIATTTTVVDVAVPAGRRTRGGGRFVKIISPVLARTRKAIIGAILFISPPESPGIHLKFFYLRASSPQERQSFACFSRGVSTSWLHQKQADNCQSSKR
mmetsp:Transcript_2677/g.6251  ORF Transcript_2677/g.6251 Transcript_2677/m.6251 type:complete len:116 (-) Transcript_2677:208-555(-)